ncbi:MAG: DUF1002 domain-containing protein, partial [Bacilli bacterium]
MLKKIGITLCILWTTCVGSIIANADVAVGDSVYTLGANLSNEQKTQILTQLGFTEGQELVYVTNAEEHKYLGGIIPKAQIGTRALSSSKITMSEPGTGVLVQTDNINWVTPEMYSNAMITAGLKDAVVMVTAPFSVSGTAALTGIMKAYETTTGEPIDEEKKQVANEEMVTTAKLGDTLGTDVANNLMSNVKLQMAEQMPTTEEAVTALVGEVANSMGITIGEAEQQNVAQLMMRMQDANVDWGSIQDQLQQSVDNWNTKFEELKTGFFDSIAQWFADIWNGIVSFFTNIIDQIVALIPGNETPESEPKPVEPESNTETEVKP